MIEEAQHSRICCNYIFRYGLGENLGETGQQTMARVLTAALQKKIIIENEFMVIALLNELSHLFLILGEGASPVREVLANEVLPPLLGHASVPVRLTASICYRCLGTALPASLAQMINDANNRVKNLTVQLKEKSDKQQQKDKESVALSTAVRSGYLYSSFQTLVALQGNSFSLGALIAVVPSTKLGVPNTATNVAVQLATTFLATETSNSSSIVSFAVTIDT